MAETLQNINKPKETLNEPLEKENSDLKQSAVLEKAPEMVNEDSVRNTYRGNREGKTYPELIQKAERDPGDAGGFMLPNG